MWCGKRRGGRDRANDSAGRVCSPEGGKATVACTTSFTSSCMCFVGRPGSVAYMRPTETGPASQPPRWNSMESPLSSGKET